MVPMLIQILRWLMQPFIWRFVGFGSAVVGLLCYALSSSFNHLFGQWNLFKIFLYTAFSFIISLLILYAEKWKHSRSLRFKAHSAFLVLTITSVFSFFSDKVMNGKPDAYSLISCAAFAIMTLSLSRQTQCGFEVDLLYFFLGCLTVQLMKIKLELAIVGAGFSYSLVILRSSFSSIDAAPQNEYAGVQDQHSVVIEVDSPQVATSSIDITSMMQQLTICVEALHQEDSKLIDMLLNEVKEYLEGTESELLVTDHNFVIDALPSGRINDLQQTVKILVGAGFEKECSDMFSNWRREWLEECLTDNLVGSQEINIQNEKEQERKAFLNKMITRWNKASIIALKILFPSERRLCDRVFSGFSSAAERCFTEVCRGSAFQLLNFADVIADESPSVWHFFNVLHVFEGLRDLITEFQSMFPNSLVNEAIKVQNRLGEASRELFLDFDNLIFRVPEEKEVAPADGWRHPMISIVMNSLFSACRSRQTLEQILQEYPKVSNGAGTYSFTGQMERIMELLERKLIAKSKIYKDPALRYFFMMNNRRCIETVNERWGLGTIFGDDWFRNNRGKIQQNLELYQRSSWDKVVDILKVDSDESLSPNVAVDSMKDKLNLFNLQFEQICSVQSTWCVSNKKLRAQIITSLENILLPAYENFVGRLQNVLGKHAYEFIEYGMFDIQDRLNHLFQGEIIIQNLLQTLF
ncbi:Exocyst complex component Exo70 [Sesbania bispinosa]|nr:Exocyst complex component Exo70 [Sesbania bispinosa]